MRVRLARVNPGYPIKTGPLAALEKAVNVNRPACAQVRSPLPPSFRPRYILPMGCACLRVDVFLLIIVPRSLYRLLIGLGLGLVPSPLDSLCIAAALPVADSPVPVG